MQENAYHVVDLANSSDFLQKTPCYSSDFLQKQGIYSSDFLHFHGEKLWKRRKWWQALDRRKETHNNQKRDSFLLPVVSAQVRFHLYKGAKAK